MRCVFCAGSAMVGLVFLVPFSLLGETPSRQNSDQAQEYFQARKIAMKDARVQAAFDRAYGKLDERIIEIDPSLKHYVEKHGASGRPVAAEKKSAPPQPPKKSTHRKKSDDEPAAVTHIVARGETPSSIALLYKISVSQLKKTNHINDDRALRIGQKLVIPSAGAVSKKPGDEGFWSRVKKSF